MEQWRLPVQGFSLRSVESSRAFSDDADRAEFMKAEAIILRGLSRASCPNLRSFEVVKVEIVANPRLKRKFEAKKSKEVEEGGSGESLMLCHGTPKENILPIVQFNFDPAFISHGRAFGNGVYFSECPELSLRYSCSRRGQNVFHGPEELDGTYTLILCEVLKGSLPVFKEFLVEDGRAAVIVVNEVDRVLPRYVVTLGQNSISSRGRVSFPHLGRSGGRITLVSGNQQQETNLPTAVPDTPESRGTRARTALRHLRSQQPGSGSAVINMFHSGSGEFESMIGFQPGSSVLRTALEQISSRHPSSSSAAGRSLAARTALRHLDNRSAPTMLSSEVANTSDPPVDDPVTDALAAAIYHVMEQLGQMVGLLFSSFSSRLC